MKKSPVVHFELPAKDKKRVSEFYSKVFGWEMQQLGPEMGDYIMTMTTDSDEKGPLKPGAINGGFFDYKDDELNKVGHVVISVEDIDQTIEDIKASGGEVKTDKMDIPGVGVYVSIKDTEGNIVGVLQPPADMNMR